ncbi:MAG: ATP-binding protein [Bacteroidota bacterium]
MNDKVLMDSIDKLDSLVNVNKAINFGQSLKYANRALSLALINSSPIGLVKGYTIIGTTYINRKNDSSYFYFSKALNLVEKYKIDPLKPHLLYNLAKLYNATYDHKRSIRTLDSVIRLASKYNDFVLLSNAYNDIGNMKFDLHDLPDARHMFDTSYKIAQKHLLYKQMGVALGNLARFEKDLNQSLIMHKRAIGFLEKNRGTEEARALLLINMGNRFEDQDSAIKYYQSAISLVDSGSSSEAPMIAYNNLAYAFINRNEYSKAEVCLIKNAIPMAGKNENLDWLSTLYDTYTDLLLSQRKYEEAVISERKALGYREKADERQASEQVRLLAALLDLNNKETRIQTNERELQRKASKIQQMNTLLIISILLISFAVFFILWIIQRNKLKNQTQIVSSAKRIIDLEENLKERLAMELHDMTSPIYTNLLRQIEETYIPDTVIKEDLQIKLTELADRIRQISHKMNKVYIEHLTFSEIVQGLFEDMRFLTTSRLNLNNTISDISLSPEKATHIVRIIQELLYNAVKYATNSEINVSISLEYNNINILYHDNGPGFDDKNPGIAGIGLLIIFERAKLLGGKAVLNAASQNGTHWIISIPN